MDLFSDLFAVFGRTHPLLLHLPIGILVGIGLVELVALKRGAAPVSRLFVFFATASAVLAAASGWVLHEEPGYATSEVLQWHEWLGIATASGAIVCFLLRLVGAVRYYRFMLLATLLVMLPTGHFGAEMTHGKGFLWEPLEESEEPAIQEYTPPVVEESGMAMADFTRHVAPLLKARCSKCHGARKSKGDLRLDSADAIRAGGEGGSVIAFASDQPVLGSEQPHSTGQPEAAKPRPEDSELFARLLLPLEHDDHMPPESKTQLKPAEVELLRAWLLAGAPFDTEFELGEGAVLPEPPELDAPRNPKSTARAKGPKPAPEQAILALREQLVHVQVVEPGSVQLWIDFAAPAATMNDARVKELLAPLADYVADLSLATTHITDESLGMIAAMPNLQSLDLRKTAVTDTGLTKLRGHKNLRKLILSQTLISGESIGTFQQLPALTHLWLWSSGIAAEDLARLRSLLPEMHIDAGDLVNDAPLETEGDLVFTNDAPSVDAPLAEAPAAAQSTAALTPINTICPVSEKAVDPRYLVVYEGRVIGFCCENCPKTFWEDPQSFASKLPQ